MVDENNDDKIEVVDQHADAAAARDAAKAAAERGTPTDADLEMDRANATDAARAKIADAAKVAAKEKATEKPADKQAPADKVAPAEAAVFAEASDEDKAWSKEAYGEQVAGVMEKAGINAAAANDYWQEHGKLPEKAFAQLEAAGYPRTMVNAYLAGVSAEQEKAAQVGQEFGREVARIAGSSNAWDNMTKWASTNFTQQELTDFNAVIDSQNIGAMRIAATSLKARFEQANGKLPRVAVTGAPHKDTNEAAVEEAGGDVFKTTAEITAAVGDPRYSKDPTYRRATEQKVARSNLFGKARASRGK